MIIIQININFNCKQFKKDELGLYSKQRKLIVTDILTILNINVDLYVEDYYNNSKKFKNGEELIVMLGLEKAELAKLAKRSDKVMQYKKLADKVNNNDEIISWFSAEEERKMYQDALVRKSKKDGLIEGEKKGKQAGILSVAKNMLAEDMSIDLISKLTKLSKKQINRLL